MAGPEGERPRVELTSQKPKQPEQTQPQLEGGNGSPGIQPTLNERAKPPPESRAYRTLPQKSLLNRAVERTRDLYVRNGWIFLPLGEAGKSSSSLSNLEGERGPQSEPQEQAKPKAESGLSKLLEEKGLFMADVPKGRDPQSYPIEAMKQIQSELTGPMEAADPILKDKMWSLSESARKVERAFEIIVYPVLQNQELQENIRGDLLDDIYRYGRRRNTELSDEELEALGKLTTVRGLPFDPEKRVYEYSEVPDYDAGWLFSRRYPY
jgi:hypothetical protein